MIDFLDVCERADTGPLMTERDFELRVFIPKLREVVDEYGIRYDSETPVPVDDVAADRVYQASVGRTPSSIRPGPNSLTTNSKYSFSIPGRMFQDIRILKISIP